MPSMPSPPSSPSPSQNEEYTRVPSVRIVGTGPIRQKLTADATSVGEPDQSPPKYPVEYQTNGGGAASQYGTRRHPVQTSRMSGRSPAATRAASASQAGTSTAVSPYDSQGATATEGPCCGLKKQGIRRSGSGSSSMCARTHANAYRPSARVSVIG